MGRATPDALPERVGRVPVKAAVQQQLGLDHDVIGGDSFLLALEY
jgi:hypothetical protein